MGITNVDQLQASGKIPVVQRTVTVAAKSVTTIHAAITLNATLTVTTTSAITNPDEYRCLCIKGNQANIAGTCTIVGTNWRGQAITEDFTINGAGQVDGAVPFKTVTSITLPPRTTAGDTISVGCIDILGLYCPIAATADLLQLGRKASAGTAYVLEAPGAVSATHMTVVVDAAVITAADSFEIAYNATAIG